MLKKIDAHLMLQQLCEFKSELCHVLEHYVCLLNRHIEKSAEPLGSGFLVVLNVPFGRLVIDKVQNVVKPPLLDLL